MQRVSALCLIALAGCPAHERNASAPDALVDTPSATVDAPASVNTLVATPASLDFGSIPVNGTTPPLTVTLVFTGTPELQGQQTIVGPDAAAFSFEGAGCISIADTCTTRVRFSPTSIGTAMADLVVMQNGARATVPLRGIATQTESLQIVPSVHDFGAVGVGATTSRVFTLTNATTATTGALSVTMSGVDASQFTTSSDSCTGTMVAESSTCSVVVAFSPSSPGAKAATLKIAGSPGGSVTSSLLGTGSLDGGLVISPATFDFGNVGQGNSSLGKMFTITNGGTTTTGLLATSMSGNNPGDFIKQFDQCNGHTLGPGSACTLFITFEPGPVGVRNARVHVAATPGGTGFAELSGTGTP